MEVLRGVRHVGRRARLTDRSGVRLRPGLYPFVLIVALLAGCKRPDPRLQPEQLLRDSLSLGDDDRVHRVQLVTSGNREAPDPAVLDVQPGDYVQFVTGDHRVHAISFHLDSVSAQAADFLRKSGQEGSPPMVVPESRFVVTFADAPPGRYPFVVVGNGEQGHGEIRVVEPKR
jgi:plastocyanin